MALGYADALRDNQLDEITTLVDAGAGAGLLRIYDGTQPSNGAAVTSEVLGAELTFSDPAFPASSSQSIVGNAITDDSSANASITATWFRVVDSNAVFVMDGPIADLNLSPSNVITVGVNVAVSQYDIAAGNAGVA